MSTVTITKSSDYNHILNQVVELENDISSSSKDLWLGMGHALEIAGFEKKKIWSIVAKDIEEKLWQKYNKDTPRKDFKWVRSGYFYRVGSKTEYVSDSDKDEIALGQSKNSSLSEYEIENSQYINIILDTIGFLKDIALPKLKENHFMSSLNEEDDKVIIALHDWDAQ